MKNGQISVRKNNAAAPRKKAAQKAPASPRTDLQSALARPETATQTDLLKMQAEAGNTAVGSWLSASGLVQRETLTDASGLLNEPVSGAIQRARGKGQPLPDMVQRNMEGTFSADLGQVRVHTGSEADHLSQQLSARAFTIGSDIFFRRDAYAPGTQRGERTLKHELTHVLQQGGAAPAGRLRLGEPGTAEEHQAERTAATGASITAGPGGVIRREMDYDGIATAFGGSVTAEMVKKWTINVKPKNHATVQDLLLKGKTLEEFQRGMLTVYGVDLAAMAADTGAKAPDKTGPESQSTSTSSGNPSGPQLNPTGPTAPQTGAPGGQPAVTKEDIEAFVLRRSKEEHMPSGALLDALKDIGQGDLSQLSSGDVDQVIQLFKARDFDGLSKKGISISHIVAFTGGYERLGVGDTKDPNRGISGAAKDALLGSQGRWEEGKAAGVADFLQNSLMFSGLSGLGALTSNLSVLNSISTGMFGGNEIMGQGAINGTELAGGIATNLASTIQSVGTLTRAGVDFGNAAQTRGFNRGIRGDATRQQASEGAMNTFFGLSGLASSGLGFGLAGQNFEAGGSVNNADSELGLAKGALDAGTGAISMGARGVKMGMASHRKSEIAGINYRPSTFLSIPGRQKEASVFPKLKAVLMDAQSKKVTGQGVDMGKDFMKTSAGVLRGVGFGLGAGTGSLLKMAGAVTGLAGSLAGPLINKIKGVYTDKKVEKSGYRNLNEYRSDRVRSLETVDETGQKGSVNVRIGQVADEANDVYEDFQQENTAMPASNLEGPVTQLSISRLLNNTGEYMQLNTVFTSKDRAERRESIKNILLSRTATY